MAIDKIDLLWTSEGDYVLDENLGDLEDTRDYPFRAKLQQMHTRLSSERGDWAYQGDIGATLSEFLGSPNTRQTGESIKARVASELVREGLVPSSDLIVDVAPLGERTIAILVAYIPLGSNRALYLNFTYDLAQNRLIPRNH